MVALYLLLSLSLSLPRRPKALNLLLSGSSKTWRVLGVQVLLGIRVQGSGFRVQGSGFRVQGSGFRVQSLGFRV